MARHALARAVLNHDIMVRLEADHASPMAELMQGIMAPAPPPPAPSMLTGPPPPPPPAMGSGPSPMVMTPPPAPSHSPSWMDAPSQNTLSRTRTGAQPTRGSGLHTLLFFGLIVFV